MRAFRFLCASLVMLYSSALHAHTSGASYLDVRIDDSHAAVTVDVDVCDLDALLGLDRNLDGAITWGEVGSSAHEIEAAVFARTRINRDQCRIESRDALALADHGEGTFARIAVRFACADASVLSIDHSAWFDFDPGHRALLELTDVKGESITTVLTRAAPRWQSDEATATRLRRFAVEGAVHLFTGYDHLAFLAVLLLGLMRRVDEPHSCSDTLRRALGIITAFTCAHSFTLALAASGVISLPSRPVEVTIAASVMIGALLNFHRKASRHGFKLAFVFGLVHGLGFAGALAELASDGFDLLALAAFNLGIEAGQIAVAAVAAPALWWLFREPARQRIALPLASLSFTALAAWWVVLRLQG